jgi:hypothetical protein
MTLELDAEVRERLDRHLDAVEAALHRTRRSREQRRGIVDDLETQILDMLGRRSERPTLGDMEAVLAGLDPPAAYGEGSPGTVATPAVAAPAAASAAPRYSRTAIAGFICILVSLLPLVVVVLPLLAYSAAGATQPTRVVSTGQYERDPATGDLRQQVIHMAPESRAGVRATPQHSFRETLGQMLCVLTLVGPLGLAGTVLGWIAFGQIKSSKGMIQGKGMALFDGLFYPVLILPIFLLIMA